ncbi:MAG TPA: hypothetical protein VIQ30_04955 [Pseudonocardia sp.]
MTTLDDCPDLAAWAADTTHHGANPGPLGDELLDVVKEGILAHPRSQQREIGPSQIGHPCNRWLAHFFADTPPTGLQKPPWRQAVGTAVHAEFSLWCHQWNANHGTRFLTDLKVWIGDLYGGRPIFGTLDALDVITATVIDLKVPGKSAMQRYRDGQPESPQYDVQIDGYGNGACNAGFPVSNVGILRLPAAGELHEATWKARPHNPQRGTEALARAGAIAQMVEAIGPAAIPLQVTAEHYCQRCDYFAPNTTDLTRSCPGDAAFIAKRDARPDPLHDLIAS